MTGHIDERVEQTDTRECGKRYNRPCFFYGCPILPECCPTNGKHKNRCGTPAKQRQHKWWYILIDSPGYNEVAAPHQRGQYSQANAFNGMLLVAQNGGKCTGTFALLLPKENIIRKANDGACYHH